MRTMVMTAVLASMVASTALAQPAGPAAQAADPDAQQIGRAWTAFAAGRLDEAATVATQVAGRSVPLAHEATGLLIRVEASRDRVRPALAAYERWLRQAGRDDRFLLQPVAFRLLTTLSRSADPGVRAAATARLLRAGVATAAAPADQDPMTIAARAEAGDRAALQQLAQAATADGATVRVGTVKALAAGGAGSLPQLTTLLGNRTPDVRAAAVDAIGSIGGPQAISALQKIRDDPDPYVRLRVSVALAQAGDQAALATVTTALASPVADVRLAAAEAFQANPTDASRAAVRSALGDGNPLTRARAAALLHDSDEGSRVLVELLNSDNPTVRDEAARAVEERFTDNLTLIRSLLESPDPWLQLYGSGALLTTTR